MTWKLVPMAVLLSCALLATSFGCEEAKPEDTKKAEQAAEEKQDEAKPEEAAPAEGEAAAPAEGEAAAPAEGEAAAGEAQTAKLVHQPGAKVGDWTMCPTMKNKFQVKEDQVGTDHNGQKVYFCCGGCEAKFLENPEAALTALNAEIDVANGPSDGPEGAPAEPAVAQ